MFIPRTNIGGLAAMWNRRYMAARMGQCYSMFELRFDVRHYITQNVKDLARRGLSNREGGNNRRWRKYKASAPRVVWSCAAFEIVG